MNSRQLAKTWPHRRYSDYEREMRGYARAWFESKDLKTHSKWSFCLAEHSMWRENIICEDVRDYIENERKRHNGKDSFPLHKFLHHGLSSQAMVFNLVGPLVVRNHLDPLRDAVQEAGIAWPKGSVTAGFEHDDRTVFNEDSGQPTSIDLVVSGDDTSLYIESKLVEKEFGGCSVFASGDCNGANPLRVGLDNCYLHHIGRRYWEQLEELELNDSDLCSGPICPFTCYYQFFREALFTLVKGGTMVLLYDQRSPVFLRESDDGGLWPFLVNGLPDHSQERIGSVTIQQVAAAVRAYPEHSDWVEEFCAKYGL